MGEKIKCKYCHKEVYKINLKDHQYECSSNPNIKGISGWLALFMINLYLSAIILLYYSFITEILFFNLLFLLYFGYNIFVIYTMHRKLRKFKKCSIVGLWLWAGGILIEILYLIFALSQEQFSQWLKLFIDEEKYYIIFGAISSFIWTQYILKSKRVNNTFIK